MRASHLRATRASPVAVVTEERRKGKKREEVAERQPPSQACSQPEVGGGTRLQEVHLPAVPGWACSTLLATVAGWGVCGALPQAALLPPTLYPGGHQQAAGPPWETPPPLPPATFCAVTPPP